MELILWTRKSKERTQSDGSTWRGRLLWEVPKHIRCHGAIKEGIYLGVVAHTFNPSTQEAEGGKSL